MHESLRPTYMDTFFWFVCGNVRGYL